MEIILGLVLLALVVVWFWPTTEYHDDDFRD